MIRKGAEVIPCLRPIFLAGSLAAASGAALAAERLQLERTGDRLALTLHNDSGTTLVVSAEFALSGRSRGNLVPLILTTLGTLVPACAFSDSPVDLELTTAIPKHSELVAWQGRQREIERLHCLGPGTYDVAFAYHAPDGRILVSNTIKLTVDNTTPESNE